MVLAAVAQYPAFDLRSTRALTTAMSCTFCTCQVRDAYIWDEDGENVLGVEADSVVCVHCDGQCYCDGRFFPRGERSERTVE